jgi:predicted ArsR family transcriptional regulator
MAEKTVAADRQPGRVGARQQLRAEVLADPTRFAVYQVVRGADRPLSVAEVTDSVGVHHTAVRVHLARLRDQGLVQESRAAPSGRGRPKLLYSATGDVADPLQRDPYRELSTMLATAVRQGRTPREVGVDAGHGAAVRQDPGGVRDTVDLIEAEAAELGFDPVRRGDPDRPELVLRRCPFAEVAADDPDSICSLHLGVAEGIAARRGDVAVVGMVVRDPHRAGCRLRLRRAGPAGTVAPEPGAGTS